MRFSMRLIASGVMSMPIHPRPNFCRGVDGGAAAAKRIEHHLAGIAAGVDDAL